MKLLMQINLPFEKRAILANMNSLDKNTLQSLKTWLLQREAKLLAEVESGQKTGDAEAMVDMREVNDLEDQASKRERTTTHDAEVQRDRNELADVRAALVRLRDGSYGTCIDCGQPINLQRLVAMPAAARCMPCQIHVEARAIPPLL
ncbi:MAG: TraR/DksA family transcriptional regulator [Polaromonas sp.]